MTQTDFIVGGFLGSMLLTGLLAAGQISDEANRRAVCANNLRQIGQAVMLYANENRGRFPNGKYDPDKADKVASYTGSKARHPFQAGRPRSQ